MNDNFPFSPGHRAELESFAARGCEISRYMLANGVRFPEAVEALHRLRCAEPVPVPEED